MLEYISLRYDFVYHGLRGSYSGDRAPAGSPRPKRSVTETPRQTFLNAVCFCSAKVMPVSRDLGGACAIFGSRLRVLDSDCSYRAAGDGGKVFLCGIVLPARVRSE